ncbi:RraA family protein [Streptomyces kaempferi]|uniref:Oxaloacetate decarboxylase n=1 Tax=Streptomyces kaempferi TaxID=333725 RepID=A0ABW3XTY2_9ACTN
MSHGGGTKLSRADAHGAAGVLADCRLRDFNQLGSYSFATWCGGEAVRWGGDTVVTYACGVTVEISGVCVSPGGYVYMDSAGGVMIPPASLDRVIAIAEDVTTEEAGSPTNPGRRSAAGPVASSSSPHQRPPSRAGSRTWPAATPRQSPPSYRGSDRAGGGPRPAFRRLPVAAVVRG